MDRKLASIQKVLDISLIDGADRIERATVLGWHCVVGKNEFKVGDLIVFLEVDSVTPQTETYKLLKDSGYRVKTRCFKKQVSQGLCLPLSILPQGVYLEGCDVTNLLGITKWEIYVPAQLSGQVKGSFPEFLHKTDEIRIQAVPDVLTRHKGKQFHITEKLDGSSFTAYYKDGEFGVCSRNLELKEDPNNAYWKVALELDLKGRLAALGGNHAIQGELIGQGVQGNKYKLDKLKLFCFNLYNIDKSRYYDADDFVRMIKEMGLETVPVVERRYTLTETVDELVSLSNAPSLLNKDVSREGIVFKSIYETYDEGLRGRLSFKVINPEFLLRYNE